MSTSLENAVREASERWQRFFNTGNAAGCASCYEEDASMVALPFGTFEGRSAIESFWADLIEKGFAEVEYIEPRIEVVDSESAIVSSRWKMNNAHGVITKELWVLQPNGTALLREDHFEATS